MAAPAVGHRPPDSGPDMSLYDYRNQPEQPPSPPDSDSAGSAMHDSASDRPDSSPPNGLPSVSGMFDIKPEPMDHDDQNPGDSQSNNRRQSAASALLAQLLGGQSSAPGDRTDQPVQQEKQHSNESPLEKDTASSGPLPKQETTDFPAHQNQFSTSYCLQGQRHDGEKPGGEPHSEKEKNGDTLPQTGPVEGLSDPLMSRTGLDQSNLFTPFDITAVPRTPFEALQQNELLTAAYLSQSADLSALGYSHGTVNQDGPGSMEGSEPRIQAFAKLEFDDGHFYVNTYSFILGRDVRAARAAHHREVQVRQAVRNSRTKSSSGGNPSHTPRAKHDGNGVIGSVVSDRGGIMGFDPDVPPHLPPQLSRRSSNSSNGDAPLHATPAQLQSTDYNALAMQSLTEGNGDVKPVDTLALLPSPDACPTIPIHPPATVDGSAAGHRGISRKHVKIAYNFDKNLFEMEVMGRNGAFIGADFLSLGQIRPLHSGDYIQIGGVRIRFLLPDVPVGETGADKPEEPGLEEGQSGQVDAEGEDEIEVERRESDVSEGKEPTKVAKLVLKTKDPDPAKPVPSIESSGDPSQPAARRRGPGRPPKDGIMSKRERAELAREQKLAAKREANGGVTPPPNRSKGGKTTKESVGAESPGPKPEKRKYTKRKKPDGTPIENPFPSVEGAQMPLEQRPEEYIKAPPVKKRKPSRSPSPNYPPESAYTPEDLAKPPYNYAVLIFDALTDAGTPMTLKQIYRALKLKYPYFRFKCETEGWTSSVRHNLNGNGHLFMHAERDGKGWSWQLRPGASVEKEKKRRPSPPPAPSQPPSTPSGYMPAMAQPYNPPSGQPNMANQHFQFSSMPSNPYPAPQHASPYPPPTQVPAAFPIPSPIRNNLPAAFAQTTPSTYTSPYASDPPPQLAQFQQSQSQPPPQPQQPQPSYYQQSPAPQINSNPPPQNIAPNPGPPVQQQANGNDIRAESQTTPAANPPQPATFQERASKAIDDFEAVLMEDYDDKNYIREVLRSARARALGQTSESSFPGGEPKDEAVILDALRNLVGSLKDE